MIRRPPRSTLFPLHDALPISVHEEKFISGAVERGLKREKAEKIFSLMAQFSDYGFNRSHSVAYAYLAFRSEEHTSELQSQSNLVCRLLLEKKKKQHSTRMFLT